MIPINFKPPKIKFKQVFTQQRFPVLLQTTLLLVLLSFLLGSAGAKHLRLTTKKTTELVLRTDSANNNQLAGSQPKPYIQPFDNIKIEAQASFVYDLLTKRVLYQKAADKSLPIASITKLMAALVAHELLADDQNIVVPTTATLLESTSGLNTDEYFLTKDLLHYALLASSNDAAYSLAVAGGATITSHQPEAVFIEAMNLKAKELNLNSFLFNNPHGLDESSTLAGAYGSARDISFLMEYIYQKYPELLDFTTADTDRIFNTDGKYYNASNTNLIKADIPQLLGSKTGYTILAGGNLTIIFDVGFNHPVIITVLGSSFSGRFSDVLTLIEATKNSLTNSIK